MHFNLKVLNLIHSLCDESSETPPLFRNDRYAVRSVEPLFDIADGRKCNPECLLYSPVTSNVILVESKSGTGNSADQINRYESVRPNHVCGGGFDLKKSQIKSLDIVLICDAPSATRQIGMLDGQKSSIVVVSYDEMKLQLLRGTLSNTKLQKSLSAGFAVAWPPAPHDYFLFDCNSNEFEIAQVIIASLGNFAMRRVKSFESSDVCQYSMPYWSVLHPVQKKALVTRVDRVLEVLVTSGFPGQFQISSKSKKTRLVVEVTPLAMSAARKDGNAYSRRMMTWQQQVLDDLARKLDKTTASPQFSLFDKNVVIPPELARKRRKRR